MRPVEEESRGVRLAAYPSMQAALQVLGVQSFVSAAVLGAGMRAARVQRRAGRDRPRPDGGAGPRPASPGCCLPS
jgi:hypothetical protein